MGVIWVTVLSVSGVLVLFSRRTVLTSFFLCFFITWCNDEPILSLCVALRRVCIRCFIVQSRLCQLCLFVSKKKPWHDIFLHPNGRDKGKTWCVCSGCLPGRRKVGGVAGLGGVVEREKKWERKQGIREKHYANGFYKSSRACCHDTVYI